MWEPIAAEPGHRQPRFAIGMLALGAITMVHPMPALADLFHPPVFYHVMRPLQSAVFDSNRDGLPDVIVTQGSTDSATVFLNLGKGHLERSWSFRPATVPVGVVAVDLNGDSFDDIAIACQWETLTVLLSQPDGGFSHTKYPIEGRVIGIDSGDFDNDGTPDLVLAGVDYGVVWVYRNDGYGGFAYWTSYHRGGQTHAVASGDFNRDGFLDVAASNTWTPTLLVLRGNGVTLSPTGATAPDAQTSVVAADFDSDGFLDLAGTGYSYYLTFVLRGRGDGTFDPPMEIWGLPGFQHALDVADFNLDGNPDLAVSSIGRVLILLGDGDCTFADPIELAVPDTLGNLNACAGDVDGNGSPDIVVCQTHIDTIAVFLNTTQPVTDVKNGPRDNTGAVALRAAARPNPATGHFTVSMEVPKAGPGRLELLDVQGRLIESRGVDAFGPGRHTVPVGSGLSLRPGIYLIRFTHGGHSVTTRACLIE